MFRGTEYRWVQIASGCAGKQEANSEKSQTGNLIGVFWIA